MDSEPRSEHSQEWGLGVVKLLHKHHLCAHKWKKANWSIEKKKTNKKKPLYFCIYTHLHLSIICNCDPSTHVQNWRRTKEGKMVDWKYRLTYKEQQLWSLAKQWFGWDMIEICKIVSDVEGVNQNWLFATSSITRLEASDKAGRWHVQNKHEEAALHTTRKGNSGTLRQGMLWLLKLYMDSGDNRTSWEMGNPLGTDKQTKTTSGTGISWNTNCWSLGKSREEVSLCC